MFRAASVLSSLSFASFLAVVLVVAPSCDPDAPPIDACPAGLDDEQNCAPECAEEMDPIVTLTSDITQGTTVGASDEFTPDCALSTAPDITHLLVVPGRLVSLVADTDGSQFDTVLTIESTVCSEPELACNDDGGFDTQSRVQLDSVAPGVYSIVVDGFDAHSGAYTLHVHGVIAGGEACDPAVVATGLFSCESAYACVGGACMPAACNNGLDDDMDGLIDVAEDPGCVDISDGDEVDDCPAGPQCPACSNGLDDDEDGVVDFPADRGCGSPRDDDELDCDDSDGIVVIETPQTTGSTFGAVNNLIPSCSGSSAAADIVHELDVPGRLNFLSADTFGATYDTILYARQSSCNDPDLVCNDDTNGLQSSIWLGSVPPGTLYIIVDGFSTAAGDYTLNVSGEIAVGEPCDVAQVTSGLLTCAGGTTCVDQRCQ